MNACAMVFIAAGAKWGQPDGQIMFLLILAIAAAEVAVALGHCDPDGAALSATLDVDAVNELRE